MKKLQQDLKYTFKNTDWLKQALTHSSLTADIHKNYERLEFLGDRILGVTIADMLCQTFINEAEGELAQRFVHLVCKETVAEVMRNLNVTDYIEAANPEVCNKDNVLCDVGEAIIAAIYYDSGDLTVAQNFIRTHWKPLIDRKSHPTKDYKTHLQELAAKLALPLPQYQLMAKTGPEHAPSFEVKVIIGEQFEAYGNGSTKKQAEQNAAAQLIALLENNNG